MSGPPLDIAADVVLGRYPTTLTSGPRRFLGNHGGFSGARLWKIGGANPLCLRAWPAEQSHERLTTIHRWMTAARTQGLLFVPTVLATSEGPTAVAHAGRVWDLTTWLPGTADFRERPSPLRIAAACQALARLHVAWSGFAQTGPCPAVLRRFDRAESWQGLLQSGWRPAFPVSDADPVAPWAERAWHALQGRIESTVPRLSPWSKGSLPLQVCLCDVWHAHVLFDGDSVTGLIDYGSARVDHVAADLARLLGSLVGDDADLRRAGFEAYRTIRPLSAAEEELVNVLDETGTLLSAANWLRWLYHDRDRHFDNRAAIAERLAELVRRIEPWK